MAETEQDNALQIDIRTYQPEDQPTVDDLYVNGLLEGAISPNDTGADIDHIAEGYLHDERANFWVAEADGKVVGMIGVAPDTDHVAEIRRLRVYADCWGKGIRTALLKTAVAFCRHHGYLKVVLDTRYHRGEAMQLFEDNGFQHHRDRSVPGKEQIEFFFDIYRDHGGEED